MMQMNTFLALKSLIYFEDAEKEQMPFMLDILNWGEVKSVIKDRVNDIIG